MNDIQTLQAQINTALQSISNPLAIVLEGRDGAGKTGAIRSATEYLPFSQYRIIHSRKPSDSAMNNWLPYWSHQLPEKIGQIFFFDRSWYSRSLCQRLNGWCSDRQVDNFLERVEAWENRVEYNGINILKFWLSISADTQKERLTRRIGCPLRGWKFSANDENALKTYDQMTDYKNDTFNWSSNWNEVDFNDKEIGQKQMLKTILYTLRGLRND